MTRKTNLLCLLIAAVVGLALPWLTQRFVGGDAAMAVCFLLFFAVDPMTAIAMGIVAGRRLRASWFLPLTFPALYLLGVWLCFEPGETAFLIYAAGYLLLGLSAMLLSDRITKIRANKGGGV